MRDLPRSGLATAAALFVADQIVKWFVVSQLGLGFIGAAHEVTDFFALRFVPNVGVSLGLLPADGAATRWALVVLTGLIAIGVAVWMWRERNRADRIALGFVLGGALGNILDRIRLGYVVDFADLHFGEWRPFLVFNVADAAITVGVLILLVRSLLMRDKRAKPVIQPVPKSAPVENTHA